MSIQNKTNAHAHVDAGTVTISDREKVADVEYRHSIERVYSSEYADQIQCRDCGRTGFVNEISPYEFCPANEQIAGIRTDSMLGVPGGRER